jgi:hypothetical protein
MANIALPADEWVLLPITKSAFIHHRSGKGLVIYCQSPNEPSDFLAFDDSTLGKVVPVGMVVDGEFIYARSLNQPSVIVVSNRESSGSPDGSFSGLRARNVQDYNESNKKLGTQWEASRRVTSVGSGVKLFSIMKVGSNYPIDLKSRILGATGSGVIGRAYELYPEDIASYGTPDPWYNMRFDLADPSVNQPEVKLYTEAQVAFVGGVPASTFATLARKRGADLIGETNSQNQAKGFIAQPTGSNRIIYQDKIVLLEIESLDAQNIGARLEVYEGGLDLPLNQ